MKLQFTEQAVNDIVRLREFIAEKSPKAAKRIGDQLIDHIERLVDYPQLGHVLETLLEQHRVAGYPVSVIAYPLRSEKRQSIEHQPTQCHDDKARGLRVRTTNT